LIGHQISVDKGYWWNTQNSTTLY